MSLVHDRERRMVILAEGRFSPLESKTANQAIRYIPDEVVAVIDSTQSGKTAGDLLGFGGSIPVVASLGEALAYKPDTLLIGIAPTGGKLPGSWRGLLLEALEAGLHLISGLHTLLSDDPAFASRGAGRSRITDLRKVPPEYERIATGAWKSRRARTLLTVGTDCNVGKMTAALELHHEFQRRTLKSDFVATGQTGILLSGKGVAVDSVPSDFVAGAVELEIEKSVALGNALIIVEGQGSLTHQGYSGVTLGLLHGVMPDAMILVHHPARTFDDYGLRLNQLTRFIRLHEAVVEPFKVSKVAGVALNTVGMTQEEVNRAVTSIEEETGLPAGDVLVPPGRKKLADAALHHLPSESGAQ
jgi:uncharacterized NAD-dependent epimerase/dehydratase family protein